MAKPGICGRPIIMKPTIRIEPKIPALRQASTRRHTVPISACAVKLDYNQAGALDTDHTYVAQPGHSTRIRVTPRPSLRSAPLVPSLRLGSPMRVVHLLSMHAKRESIGAAREQNRRAQESNSFSSHSLFHELSHSLFYQLVSQSLSKSHNSSIYPHIADE